MAGAEHEVGVLEGRVEDGPTSRPVVSVAGVLRPELLAMNESTSSFRGIQPANDRMVVARVLHDDLLSPAGRRFERDRVVSGQLSGHAGVVPLLESGRTAADEPYLLMPYYQRGSLARLIDDHGPVAWREATFLVELVAVTLAEVHGTGVVHRNIKPANVLLTDFLLPRLADFGWSLPIGVGGEDDHDDLAVPFFSPPRRERAGAARPASDVWSLGALLWALLGGVGDLGVSPDGSTDAGAEAVALARAGLLPSGVDRAPRPVLQLVRMALSPDHADRPPNGAAFVSELRQAVSAAEAEVEAEADGSDGSASRSATASRNGSDPAGAPVTPESGSDDGDRALDSGKAARAHTDGAAGRLSATGLIDIEDLLGDGPDRSEGTAGNHDAIEARGDTEPETIDARYILLLVACIALATLAMILAALLAVS